MTAFQINAQPKLYNSLVSDILDFFVVHYTSTYNENNSDFKVWESKGAVSHASH
ncbi:MAG: hypothetical protein QM762_25185 [Chryseolinea sp.]